MAVRGVLLGIHDAVRVSATRAGTAKRDSSAAYADSFAGAKERKRRRLTSVGMTVAWRGLCLESLVEMTML